jgi:hypothetical protein
VPRPVNRKKQAAKPGPPGILPAAPGRPDMAW